MGGPDPLPEKVYGALSVQPVKRSVMLGVSELGMGKVAAHLGQPHGTRRKRRPPFGPGAKGDRLPPLAKLFFSMPWALVEVTRYGATTSVELAQRRCLWYIPFGPQLLQLVMVRGLDHPGYGAALISTDLQAPAAEIVERYASR